MTGTTVQFVTVSFVHGAIHGCVQRVAWPHSPAHLASQLHALPRELAARPLIGLFKTQDPPLLHASRLLGSRDGDVIVSPSDPLTLLIPSPQSPLHGPCSDLELSGFSW